MGATTTNTGQEFGANKEEQKAVSNAASAECDSKRKLGADSSVNASAAVNSGESDVTVSCCKAVNNEKFADGQSGVGQSCGLSASAMELLGEGKLPSLTADLVAKDCMPPNSIAVKGDLQPPPMMSLPPATTAHDSSMNSSLHKSANHRNAVHGKGSMSMDSQYMQQQSQVFVFTTQLANHAADALMNGQYPSIIAFHCSQPATKDLLSKHPLNEQQFKQGPNSWLNNFAQFKQQGAKGMKANAGMSPNVLNTQYPPFRGNGNRSVCVRPCSHGPGSCPGPAMGPTGNSDPNWPPMSDMCADIGWQSQQFANNSPNVPPNMRHPNSMATNRGCAPGHPGMSPTVAQNSFSNNQMCFPHSNCGMPMPSSMPTGTKIPDENLTPQQRQHREEQLAKIREIEMMINGSESMNNPQANMSHVNMRMPAPNQQMGGPCGPGMMDSCPPNSCMAPENEHSNDPMAVNMNNPSSVIGPNCGMANCTTNHPNMPPNCAQMEWQKMQQQFFDDRRRKCPTQMSGSSHPSPMSQTSSLNSPNPSIAPSPGKRMAGPPPPYRQGPRPLSSPHPSSPAANSSRSLPSPQIQSPADSSRPFSTGTSCRLPPYASPGPPTPLGDNVNVPINSPKPGANTSLSSTTSAGASNTPISRTPTTTGCNTTPSNPTSNTSPSMKKNANLSSNTLTSDNAKSDSSLNSSGLMSEM
ncbi:Protein BCL9-like protein [Leptotrombidium deliense]|uniref:Protein BCL9-like protein n=1 Tax=Leptotrombidium deliense TaxID=299467 RepID=A0A443SA94_9ACAR|nr:Protein BCL9-like protein [Leptotrombidium deliense]